MIGLNDFVIVIVVNALADSEKRSTNFFDTTASIRLAAIKTMSEDTIGNAHARSDIQKQVFTSSSVKNVRQAYGFTGTNYATHSAYRNGKQLQLDDKVCKNEEIILIKNSLDVRHAIITAGTHRILPERTGS